jgi:hypothetical protein
MPLTEQDKSLHMIVGELVASSSLTLDAVARQTSVIESMQRDVQQTTRSFDRLEEGLKKTNQDIITLRDGMLTKEAMRHVGIDLDDADGHKMDMKHLREIREKHEENKPIGIEIKKAVLALIATGIVGWAGAAMWTGFTAEVAQVKESKK